MNCKKTTTLLNFKKEEREREKGNTVKNTYEPFSYIFRYAYI